MHYSYLYNIYYRLYTLLLSIYYIVLLPVKALVVNEFSSGPEHRQLHVEGLGQVRVMDDSLFPRRVITFGHALGAAVLCRWVFQRNSHKKSHNFLAWLPHVAPKKTPDLMAYLRCAFRMMNCCMSPRQRRHVSAVPVHSLKIVHAGKVRKKHFIKLKGEYTLQPGSYRITHRANSAPQQPFTENKC